MTAEDFLGTIGVNTHLNYMDTSYRDYHAVAQNLAWLGITQVRDAAPAPWVVGSGDRARYFYLARRGVRFDFIVHGAANGVAASMREIDAMEKGAPGSVIAVEGFNEIDHTSITFDDKSGLAAALAAQAAIYRMVHEDALLAEVPVYRLTGVDPEYLASYPDKLGDDGNLHVFPQNGEQPNPPDGVGDLWISDAIAHARVGDSSLPLVMSEYGYFTIPQSGWNKIGVDDQSQAKGVLNGLCDATRLGVSKIFLYELLDQKPDYQNSNGEFHYGLFGETHRPKLAAWALKRMIAVLRQGAGTADGAVDPKVSVLPPNAADLILTKPSAVDILLWNEAPFWNHVTGRPVLSDPVISDQVGARIEGEPAARFSVYDPLAGADPVQSGVVGTGLTIQVPDHPIIVEITRG